MSSESDSTIPDELLTPYYQARATQENLFRDFVYRKQKAIIMSYAELDKVNFNEVEQEKDTVRTNNEKTRCILTWKTSSQPAFISQLSEYEGPFSVLEIDHILKNPEWIGGDDDDVEVNEETRAARWVTI